MSGVYHNQNNDLIGTTQTLSRWSVIETTEAAPKRSQATMTHKFSTALALILALGTSAAMAQGTTTDANAGAGATTTMQTTDANASGGAGTDANTGTTTDANAGATTDAAAGAGTATDANAATGAGAVASTSVEISTAQQTEIRTVITEVNVEPVVTADIDFDISVGTAVPKTIVLKPVPVRIVEIEPAYDGFLFFMLDDGRIVIVDPDSLQIVLIINA